MAGVIYGSHVPNASLDDRGVGFVCYIVVDARYRRRGVARKLVEALQKAVNDDAYKLTGKPPVGMLFEIEFDEHAAIKNLVTSLGGYPLDIVYYQPSVREGCAAQQMGLWFMPYALYAPDAQRAYFPTVFIHKMVRALFVNAHSGYGGKGFDMQSLPYQALTKSLLGRTKIALKTTHP